MLTKLMCCAIIAKEGLVKRVNSFITKENGEVNIVAIVVLIGIAVILAVVFRKGIEKILKSLFSTIETNANDAITA